MNVLTHRPSYRHTIIGTRSPADLVKQNETAPCRIVEDTGRLIHLNHKGTLAGSKVVRCSDTGKNPIDKAYFSLVGRNEASHLGKQGNEADLPKIRAFACHIRTRNDKHALSLVEQTIIRDIRLVNIDNALQDRMTSVLYAKHRFFNHNGLTIAILIGNHRERTEAIKLRYTFSVRLYRAGF